MWGCCGNVLEKLQRSCGGAVVGRFLRHIYYVHRCIRAHINGVSTTNIMKRTQSTHYCMLHSFIAERQGFFCYLYFLSRDEASLMFISLFYYVDRNIACKNTIGFKQRYTGWSQPGQPSQPRLTQPSTSSTRAYDTSERLV